MARDCESRNGVERRARFAQGTGIHEPHTTVSVASPRDDELAQIVHDLKNPLSSIALEVELLESRIASDRLDATQAIGRIRRNVTFLDRMIYDLMDVCTLSSGRLALRRVSCDLHCLVSQVIDRVVPTSERHRVFLDAEGAPEALVDELRIERVIANLLDNALRYTPASAGIVVRLVTEAHRAHISICDAGPGLSPSEIEVVFEPYRRAANPLGRSGTGLGLYVSKQIVEAHGGSIGVESVRGAGARFFFALPLA
jgi:signal transduction histidine kinase